MGVSRDGRRTEPTMATDHTPSPDDQPPADHADAAPDQSWPDDPVAPRPTHEDTERRVYIEIRPDTTPLDHGAVRAAMVRLAGMLSDATTSGILATLTRSRVIPLVEFLLVADGHADTGLRYLVRPTSPGLFETVWDICRTAFPNEYELREVWFHPLELEWACPPPAPAPEVSFSPRPDPVETDDDSDPLWQFGPAHDASGAVETSQTQSEDDSADPDPEPERWTQIGDGVPYVAGVEYRGVTRIRADWQTPLRSFAALTSDPQTRTDRRVPLVTVAEALADAPVPAVYQAVIGPFYDWTSTAEYRIRQLNDGRSGVLGGIWDFVFPRSREERQRYQPPLPDQRRIEGISDRSTRHSVTVSARAVALTRTDPDAADRLATRLKTAFEAVAGDYHEVQGHVATDGDRGQIGDALGYLPTRSVLRPGQQLYADLLLVRLHAPTYHKRRGSLPFVTPQSRALILDPSELPHVCLVGGAELPHGSQRALSTRRAERTGLSLPPPPILDRYRGPGWPLGIPLDADRTTRAQPVCLVPDLQTLHLLIVGATGAGKSTTLTTGMLANHAVTDGPAILIDAKGGGMARDYLRTHYAQYGHLDDVIYLNCAESLPAVSLFDIRPLLDVGVAREEARSRVAGHYQEVLQGVMGAERFGRAIQSPKVIRNHLRALFDPVHGADAVSHRDLVTALRRTQRDREPPAVTDPALEGHFDSLLASEPRVFSQVMGGALARVETIATDGRLAPLFDHVPEEPTLFDDAGDASQTTSSESIPETDGQDAGREPEGVTETAGATDPPSGPDVDDIPADESDSPAPASSPAPSFSFTDLLDDDRVIVIDFGGMEDSVKRTLTLVLLSQLWVALRARDERTEKTQNGLVNLYLEDAGSVANTTLVDTLLSQGRSFGLSVTLGVQYPGQLATSDPSRDTYREALNETATMLVGNVSVDEDLARVLATDAMDPSQIARRLASLGRGEWLCRPAAEFGADPPAPFLLESLPPPPGHPASDEPVADVFTEAFSACRERSTRRYGLPQTEIQGRADELTGAIESGTDADDSDTDESTLDSHIPRLSCLPHTQRLPSCVRYVPDAHTLACVACGSRYDPSDDGMVRAITCCHSLADVDPDDIPVTQVNLKLDREAVQQSPWSLTQLLFVQVVHNAQHGRYEPPGYDLFHDSMLRLREYVGIDPDAVVDLVDAGLITEDGDYPHRLYSVTADGRDAIREPRREGVDYGDGLGDLDESSQHRLLVELGTLYLERAFVENPDSDAVRVKPYHEITVDGDPRRLDCAALDEDGDVVAALEGERINHDVNEAVPADFDKMAACDPDESIWVVLTRADGHRVIEALFDPPDGTPRVEKTYSRNTPPHKFQFDTPGLSRVFTATYLRDTVLGV